MYLLQLIIVTLTTVPTITSKNIDERLCECPELKQINCPPDSYQMIEFQDYGFENDNNRMKTDEIVVKKISEMGNYRLLNRRSLADVYSVPDGAADIKKTGCPRKCPKKQICQCDLDKCVVPHCNDSNTVLTPVDPDIERKPGHCCMKYECRPRVSCLVNNREYENGTTWQEDECTECRCHNGEHNCQMSTCKALSCKVTINIPDKCCPVCDPKDTLFCPDHEDCDKVCMYGYRTTQSGCFLCECERRNVNNVDTLMEDKVKVNVTDDSLNAVTNVTSAVTNSKDAVDNCNDSKRIYVYIIIGLAIMLCTLVLSFVCFGRKTGNYSPVSTIDRTPLNNHNEKSCTANIKNEFYIQRNRN